MTMELKKPIKLNVDTVRKPKWEIYDLFGSTTFSLLSATFSLKNAENDVEVDSGSASVNNADTDPSGRSIKTVQPTIDLNKTDAVIGMHQLSFKVSFVGGETDVFRVPIEVVDYEEVT